MNRLEALRAGYGLYQRAAAPVLARRAGTGKGRLAGDDDGGGEPDPVTAVALRILGLRHLVQAGLLAGDSCTSAAAHQLGGLVDAAHAASMVVAAAVSPSRRHLAVRDGLVATALAIAEFSMAAERADRR